VLVSPRAGAVPCEHLVGQDRKGGDRDGHLDDDRADRQEPNFALGLRVHGLPNAEVQGSIRAYRKSFGLQPRRRWLWNVRWDKIVLNKQKDGPKAYDPGATANPELWL
jgi:hypothetical protein